MGVSLNAGLDTRKAFENCKHLLGKGHTASLSLITNELEVGQSLHECIRQCPKTFPPLLGMMVQVGELSGRTESAFMGLADYYDNRVALIRGFFKSIAWPVLQLVLATMVIGLMLLIIEWLTGGPSPLFPIRLNTYLSIVSVFYAFAIGISYCVHMQWLNIEVFVGLLSILPGVKHPFLNLALSRLCWTFSLVHNAGVDAERCAAMAIKSSGNPVYTKTLEAVLSSIRDNHDFHSSFAKTKVYPTALLTILETTEQTGTISEGLWREAGIFREKAERQLRWLSKIFSGMVYGCCAVIIGAVIISMFMGYLNILNDAINL